MINKCTFIGRTTKDIELKEGNGCKYAKFTIACDNGKDNNGKEQPATFVNLTAFNKDAEKFMKHVPKGSLVYVETVYKTGSHNKGDVKTYYHDFIITFSRILSSNKNSSGKQQDNNGGYPNEQFGAQQNHYEPPQNYDNNPFDY